MYLHPRVDVHSLTRTQYRSLQTPWLAMKFRTCVSSYLVLVTWIYLYFRVDVHPGTRAQCRSLQMSSRYPLSYLVLIATSLYNGMNFNFTWYYFTGIFLLLFRTAID
ncbi:unnamed protein product [Schistosoma margrebowiei]|uniref:Uncharacterized protein n=1 Tax=Schistosoma margrebowiei TaxID=48269 RepID=A0A183LGK7_9TREM|nr:unnamed protein product [Schistosoma margrebowiei]